MLSSRALWSVRSLLLGSLALSSAQLLATAPLVSVSNVSVTSPVSFSHSEIHSCAKADETGKERPLGGDSIAGHVEDIAEKEAGGENSKKTTPPKLAKPGEEASSTADLTINVAVFWLVNSVGITPSAKPPTVDVAACPEETSTEYGLRKKAFESEANANANSALQTLKSASPLSLSPAELSTLLKGKNVVRTIQVSFFKDTKDIVITIIGKRVTDRPLGGG